MNDTPKPNGDLMVTRDGRGRVTPGSVLNPVGRRRGSRNVFAEHFIADLFDHWREHGREAIDKLYADDLGTYFRVIVRLMPQKIELDDVPSPLDGVPADVLEDFIKIMKAIKDGRAVKMPAVDVVEPVTLPPPAAPAPETRPAWPDVSAEVAARGGRQPGRPTSSADRPAESSPIYSPPPARGRTREEVDYDAFRPPPTPRGRAIEHVDYDPFNPPGG